MTEPEPHEAFATSGNTNVAAAAQEFAKQSVIRLRLAMIGVGAATVVLACVIAAALHIAIHATTEIQQSRYQNCVAQNQRHDKSLAYVVHLAHQYDKGASKAKRATVAVVISQDRILFQDAIPHENCAAIIQPPPR